MKYLYVLFLVLISGNIFCQKIEEDKFTKLGEPDNNLMNYESPVLKYKTDIDKKTSIDSTHLFNEAVLNILFAEKVGKAFTGTNDLSIQKYFANVNTTDESISLGFNFDNRFGNPLEKLSFVFTGGFKFQGTESDSEFYKSSNDNKSFKGSKVGALFKISFIGDGTINYNDTDNKKRKDAIKKYRELIYPKFGKKVLTYNSSEFPDIKELHQSLSVYDLEMTSIKDQLEEKHKKIYQEMAEEEIKYIQENDMYHSLWSWWLSWDIYLPFGDKEYSVTPFINDEPTTRNFYGFKTNLSGNFMKEWSSGFSFFGKLNYHAGGTNNILLDEIKPKSFQTGRIDEENNVVINKPIEAYDTNWDYFINQSITPEFIVFYQIGKFGSIGLSPAIEYNFGNVYKATNWKFGIPISLNDKKGKPTVNFEIQWKEKSGLTNTFHYVGLTTSLLFGSLLY